MQDALAAFMTHSGPDDVVLYNFGTMATQVKVKKGNELVKRIRYHAERDDPFHDSWALLPAGTAALDEGPAGALVVSYYFYCTGRNKKPASAFEQQARQPNCWSVCGFPANGFDGCCAVRTQRYHRCGYRVCVMATLEDIKNGRFRVRTDGFHVPPSFAEKRPPSTLQTTRSAKLQAVERVVNMKMLPAQSAQYAYAQMAEKAGAVAVSTRHVPSAQVVSTMSKRCRRGGRGGMMDDQTRLDRLVREVLIKRGVVLLYIPGVIIVVSTPWALERVREFGGAYVASDAKVDTVHGATSFWSSIRFAEGGGAASNIAAAWIAPVENAETIEMGAAALKKNVRCTQSGCEHRSVSEHSEVDGQPGVMKYEQWVECHEQNEFKPRVAIDKHWPSFRGFAAAGYGPASLCRFHIPRCLDKKMIQLGIKGAAATALHGAFRIVQRARNVGQARALRSELVKWMYAECILADPLYTEEQASSWIAYFDKCWIYAPACIARSWIDGAGLGITGYLSTSSICEASHAMWTKHLLHCFQNKLVSTVVTHTMGISFDGKAVAGMFPENRRRTETGGSQAPRRDKNARLAEMRARLEFLTHYSSSTAEALADGGSIRMQRFRTTGIRGSVRQHTNHGGSSWRLLQLQMLEALQHGGTAQVGCPSTHIAIERETLRCSCEVGVWFGVLLARGACKHGRLLRLRERAAQSGWRAVAQECAKELGAFVLRRQQTASKTGALTDAMRAAAGGNDADGSKIAAALASFPSFPPSGTADRGAGGGNSSSDSESDFEELECVMPVAADPGLVLAPLDKGEHAVVAFSGDVPKVVSGTAVQAGDVLLGVTVTADGCLPPSTEPATIKFRRRRGGRTQRVDMGGRRAKVQPKFRAPVMLGGSPAVARPKPQRTKASALPAAVISPVCLAHASSMSVAMSACGGTAMATTALSLRLGEWLKEKTAEEQQQIEEGLDTTTYVD